MEASHERVLEGPRHLDVARTLGDGYGPADPSARRDEDGVVWRATRTAAGPATLAVEPQDADGRIHARAWGPGATAILDALPDRLGFADTLEAFVPHDPVVRALLERHPGLRFGRGWPAHEVLPRVIVGQRVTFTEAQTAWRGLVLALGEPAPGPGGLVLPPTPAAIRATPTYALQRHQLDAKRATTLREVARIATRLDALAALPAVEAYGFLQRIRGIGPWTAAKTVRMTHGWPDAIPLADYHLPNGVAWVLAGEPRADDDRMLALLAPYKGHRGRVLALIEAAGLHAPAYGPRNATHQQLVHLASRKR